MKLVIRHIEYLMLRHDRVAVAGLGTVNARWRSAECVATQFGQHYNAPRREYSMTFAPTTCNDDLLATSIARSLNITLDEARQHIAADVEAIRNELASIGRVELGRLGTIERRRNATLWFVPAQADYLTPLATWLPTVRNQVQQQIAVPVAQTASKRRSGSFWRYAAAAAVIVAVALATSTPIVAPVARVQQAAAVTLPEVKPPQTAYVPHLKAPVLDLTICPEADSLNQPVDTAARSAYQRQRAIDAQASTVAKPQLQTHATAIRIEDDDPYCVIVASLTSQADAQKFIDSHRAGRFGILAAADSLHYRVYAATAPTAGAASAAARSLQTKFGNGVWVCAR